MSLKYFSQKKLHDEVLKIDAHFEAKKRKFLEDSEKFRRELKRVIISFITVGGIS